MRRAEHMAPSASEPVRLLTARVRSGEEFLERFLDDLDHGGLFVPTRKVLEVGTDVIVDVRMPVLRDRLLVRGEVAWRRRGQRRTGVRAGLGIAFLPSEAGKGDHLLRLAQGEADPGLAQRRYERLPVNVPVDWRVPHETARHPSSLEDISTGGAFIRTTEIPPLGSPIVLEIVPPGALAPQVIEGRVAWERLTPGAEGFGVEFRARDIGGMRRLRELIRRIRQSEVASFH